MTQEIKHTPSPWEILKIEDSYTSVCSNTLIAKVYSTKWKDSGNEKANVNLIASAPDLLAALKEVRENFPESPDEITQSRSFHLVNIMDKAIAKAEGR